MPGEASGGVPVLSGEWLGLYATEGGNLPERPGASARLQHDVAGGPDGAVSWVATYVDGRITSVTAGPADDVDGTFALSWKDAARMALGEDDLLVGYMQGRVKYVGDVGKVLDLVPVTQSAAYATFVAAVAAATSV